MLQVGQTAPQKILRSENGGETWILIDLSERAGMILDVKFFDPNIGLVLAATSGDNTNLVIAQIAQRRFNVPRVVVRVADPARASWYGEQGLLTVSPTKVAIDLASDMVLTA